MKKIRTKEFIIGASVLLSLLILFFGIDYLKGINVFKSANYYYASYTNVTGLAQSAPVTLNGFKVGLVRDISYEYDNPGHVQVELSLDRELKVPVGSVAKIESDLLGTATVVLHFTDAKTYEPRGGKLIAETASGMLDGVSADLMPKVSAMLPKVDSLLTNVNLLVSDPALRQSVQRLDIITLELATLMRSVNGTVAKLPPIVRNVDSITSNVSAVTSDLGYLSGQLRNLPVDSLVNDLQAVTANLHELTDQLNNPNSTLGALTTDKALYDNLNAAAASLDSLLIDVKAHPKRYISIKLL